MSSANINGFRMHYEVRGDGPPLLFAHGLMGSIANGPIMGDPSDLLTDRFRVINYDARGHGESTHTDNPLDYTWEALAADMHALLSHLEIDRAIIGGGSMGAGTSLVFQREHPEMVEKLVLLVPPPLDDETMTPVSSAFNVFANLIEGMGLERAVELAMQVPPFSDYRESDPDRYAWLKQWLLSQNPRAIVPAIRGLLSRPPLPLEALREIDVSTLILAQPDDPIHPLAAAEALHNAMAGSQLVVAPDATYFAAHREELAQTIDKFLRDG